MSDVSIVVVNWYSHELVGRCIESVINGTDLVVEVIVVDNSGDQLAANTWARLARGGVKVVRMPSNVGFGRACNAGAKESASGLILFLNPDTEMLPGALQDMVFRMIAHPDVGALGCQLVSSDGSLQTSAYGAYPSTAGTLLDILGVQALWRLLVTARPARFRQVAWAKGACMMVRRESFDAVSGFDPDFFLYAEDADLCFRISRAGWSVCQDPSIRVLHHGASTTSRHRDETLHAYYLGQMTFIRKHGREFVLRLPDGVSAALLRAAACTRACAFALKSLVRPANRELAATYWRVAWRPLRRRQISLPGAQ